MNGCNCTLYQACCQLDSFCESSNPIKRLPWLPSFQQSIVPTPVMRDRTDDWFLSLRPNVGHCCVYSHSFSSWKMSQEVNTIQTCWCKRKDVGVIHLSTRGIISFQNFNIISQHKIGFPKTNLRNPWAIANALPRLVFQNRFWDQYFRVSDCTCVTICSTMRLCQACSFLVLWCKRTDNDRIRMDEILDSKHLGI